MSCPGDNEFSALMTGALSAERAQAIHAHVEACSRCMTVMTELGHHQRGATRKSSEVDPLLRYQRGKLLGEGGMGAVYLATDSLLQREVALKLIRPDAFGHRQTELAQRFVREAQALARINHPHVVAVYDAGFSPDGAFIALEHVHGTTFGEWYATSRPSPWDVVRIMGQVGEALAEIHRAGLVHRDVKPSNVLITSSGVAKLSDFGLVTRSEPDATSVTQHGAAVGTPAYMAPEQRSGHDADARADQYAFCGTLLEGLAGAPVAGPRAAVTLAAAARRGKGLPLGLWKVLERGMHQNPNRRFASMERLVGAMRPFTKPQSWKRKPFLRFVLWTLVAATAVTLIGSTGFILGQWTRPHPVESATPPPTIPDALRGAWYKRGSALAVTATGLHAEKDQPRTTVLSQATLRITAAGRENSDAYRVRASDLVTTGVSSDADGCRGVLELRDESLQVTFTGAAGCNRLLSGTWVRDSDARGPATLPLPTPVVEPAQ